MDRPELVVEQCRLHQRGKAGILVDEPLQVGEQSGELAGRWRHERRRLDGGAG
jgi:hypothetical protein